MKDYLLPYCPYLIHIACPNDGQVKFTETGPTSTVTCNWVIIVKFQDLDKQRIKGSDNGSFTRLSSLHN